MAWTTTELLVAIRRRGRLPTDDPDYTDANLLLMADDLIAEMFLPIMVSARSEYYLRTEDQALVAKQSNYPIPQRATASTLREVIWKDSAGRTFSLPPVTLADRHMYALTYGRPICYAVSDDEVLLLPAPNATAIGTLRICYEYRPGKLVAVSTTTGANEVASVTTTTFAVVGTANTNFGSGVAVDMIAGNPPFSLLGTGAPTGFGGGTMTFAAGVIPSRLATHDYVALKGQSPIPQIPAEMHSTLALAVAIDALSQYAPAEAQTLQPKLDESLAMLRRLLIPRSKGRQIKIVNRTSSIRRGRRHRSFMGDFTG